VSRSIRFSPKQISSELKDFPHKNPVIILGKIHPKRHVYKISQILPIPGFEIGFDVMREAHEKKCQEKYHGVMKWKLGTDDQFNLIYLPDEKHYPFESLGFSEKNS